MPPDATFVPPSSLVSLDAGDGVEGIRVHAGWEESGGGVGRTGQIKKHSDTAARYRLLVYDADGTLRATLHEGTDEDPGTPTLELGELSTADSGTYVVMLLVF